MSSAFPAQMPLPGCTIDTVTMIHSCNLQCHHQKSSCNPQLINRATDFVSFCLNVAKRIALWHYQIIFWGPSMLIQRNTDSWKLTVSDVILKFFLPEQKNCQLRRF